MPYVYSTLTCDHFYPLFKDKSDPKSLSTIKKKVLIKGGNAVAKYKGLETPRGVVTFVTDEDLEFLEKHPAFKRHKERGFISVDSKEMDPAKKVADMTEKDKSAPITLEDFDKSEEDGGVTRFKSKSKRDRGL